MAILLHVILEPLFFAYYDLFNHFIDGRKLKKWQEYLLKICCLVVSVTAIFMVLIGAFWLADEKFKTYGLVLVIVGASVLLIHVIIGLFVGTNHFVKEKHNEEVLDYERFEQKQPTPQIYHIEEDDNVNDNHID